MAGELDPRAAGGKRLKDKVCIVTGSGQGIGRATARRLGEEGGTIVVADRVDESATRTVGELRENGVEAMKVLADVGSLTGAQDLMDQVVKQYGRIDVLVNNVGGTIWAQPYHKYTEEQVNHELQRTLYPTMWCCLAVLPIMMEQESGSIVNLGSQSPRGLHRLPYAVGKGGIVRDPAIHAEICDTMSAWLEVQAGWQLLGITESPITGAEGNKEFLLAGRSQPFT